MDRINNAVNKFLQEYACSQAILSEYCELFNLDLEPALRLAAGFAGGMRSGKPVVPLQVRIWFLA